MNIPDRIFPKLILMAVAGIVLLAVAISYLQVSPRESASISAQADLQNISVDVGVENDLSWPIYGQSAVATKDYGVLASYGDDRPQPTASTAKLITMLAIMQKKPFSDGEGAVITFSEADAQSYRNYLAGNGTTTRVEAGWQWTQYQALQAILLESANNISDSLAIWAFGSLESYRSYAQQMVRELGMNNTTIGDDASGYSPTTTSTASDLSILAAHVLGDPVLREISGQAEAVLPEVGTIHNTSWVVDSEVIGMKNGWLPEAGGVFALAGQHELDGRMQEIITVVMGASGGSVTARDGAYELYQSAKANFTYKTVVKKSQEVGSYSFDDSGRTRVIVASDDIGLFMWGDLSPDVSLSARVIGLEDTGSVGSIEVKYGSWQVGIPLLVQ